MHLLLLMHLMMSTSFFLANYFLSASTEFFHKKKMSEKKFVLQISHVEGSFSYSWRVCVHNKIKQSTLATSILCVCVCVKNTACAPNDV